jgi:hypothetical protein
MILERPQPHLIELAPLIKSTANNIGSVITERTIDAGIWSTELTRTISPDRYERLYGGHSNMVVRENGTDNIVILWRETHRWMDLLRAVVTEDAMARHMGIPGRKLLRPDVPLEIIDGYLATQALYVEGNHAYPWNDQQIASAARLMGRLHLALQGITFDNTQTQVRPGHQYIHADFGRGNVLFQGNHSGAVIDYEFLTYGPREHNLARTASILCVDAKLDNGRTPTPDHFEDMIPHFNRRIQILQDNYPLAFDLNQVITHTLGYLIFDKFGSLNHVRDLALKWIRLQYNIPAEVIPPPDLFKHK